MDKFDRKLQREILQACVDSYPAAPLLEQFNLTEVAECAESNIQKLLANINYLCEHGLIKNNSSIILKDRSIPHPDHSNSKKASTSCSMMVVYQRS
ncbi:hypothetical protein LN650_24575 [Klebsiella pneumoniae subsp. pneumoniae]|nr:hypothetical protein [Klebsiella pneumoniae subsp. pneumoniae]